MFFKRILFSTLLSLLATVSCADKEICDFTDEICVTKAADRSLKFILAGNNSLGLESLEPVHEKIIDIVLSHTMYYTFTDVYLYGMKDCNIKQLKFDTNLSWNFYIVCPKLILKSDYVEKGTIDFLPIEGKGNISVTYDNYHVSLNGETETKAGFFDEKPHLNITHYNLGSMEVKDNATYQFKNILNTDQENSNKAHKYLNNNWKNMNSELVYKIMKPFIDRLMKNINKFLTIVPKYELYTKNP